jgi:NAD(P)-dependent dehydrogenase (short-subunit alcohol dehydrogenase family)
MTGDKTLAVVTGGASGIGAACVRLLAARGHRVAIVDRSRNTALEAETGAHPYKADVADEAALRACAATIFSDLGHAEILVNSAGIIQGPLRPSELPMDRWDEIVRVDQRGTWLGCLVFGADMVDRRRGAIVNIASITGLRSVPLHAYAPAKAAVISITENLAAEWGPAGVRVNCVSPGYTRTPALQGAIDSGERDASVLAATSALGRMVEPVEVAQVVAFLASDEASAITGTNIPVDCGWLVATSWASYGGLRKPGNT